MRSTSRQFDSDTLYCIVQGRSFIGMSPEEIFDELSVLPGVDPEALDFILDEVKNRKPHIFSSLASKKPETGGGEKC